MPWYDSDVRTAAQPTRSGEGHAEDAATVGSNGNGDCPSHELEMTEPATRAFADYLAMPRRSLAKLTRQYCDSPDGCGKPSAKIRQLEYWSSKYGWQERIKRELAADIEETRETRRALSLACLREYHRRMTHKNAMKLGDLHGIYDRVKDPDPVSHEHSGKGGGPIKQEHEHRHYSYGNLTPEEQFNLDQLLAKVQSGEVTS